MRNSIKGISKTRRHSNNSKLNRLENDLLLTDVPIVTNDNELTTTETHVSFNDPDDIDRLLVNSGFDNPPLTQTQQADKITRVEDIKTDIVDVKQHYDFIETGDDKYQGFVADINELTHPLPDSREILNQTIEKQENTLESLKTDIDSLIPDSINNSTSTTTHPINSRYETEPTYSNKPKLSSSFYLHLLISCASLIAICLLSIMIYDLENELHSIKDQLIVLKEIIEASHTNQP